MKLRLLALIAVVAALLTSTAIAAHNPKAPPNHGGGNDDNGEAVRTTNISMEKTKFVPKDAIASITSEGNGTEVTITWTNNDKKDHDVHIHDSIGNMVAHSPLLVPGESWSFTFTLIGVYNIHCNLHPGMRGTVAIEA